MSVDPALYYSDEFISEIQTKGIQQLVVVVTSWSGSALQYPRSINIGARQSRDLPHHLALAQKLKSYGINLIIYYLSFDNTQHFNHKDKRAVDNKILPAYMNYILSFSKQQISPEQFIPIYLNPRYKIKEGDIVEAQLPIVANAKGDALAFTGENAVLLKDLQQKIAKHKRSNDCRVIGMTAHSGGEELEAFANFLGVKLIGTSNASLHFGTKEGNKELFKLAQVPYVPGSTQAQKDIDSLLEDCCRVADDTHCKRLIIKHNSSSAGKGNLDVDISQCYDQYNFPSHIDIKKQALLAITEHKHEVKDQYILNGEENFYMRKIKELGAIVEARVEGDNIVSPGSFGVVLEDGSVVVEYIYDQILLGNNGHFFGGSIGPSDITEADKQQITLLTKQVGQKLAEQGGKGYFGLDFLKCDGKELIVIEANLRKTGTKYPFIMAMHLLDQQQLQTKVLLHDDNVILPLKATDITGDRQQLNRYISHFFRWIREQRVSFRHDTKTGAIVTFDTHTANKLGVLSIADSKVEASAIIKKFKELLNYYCYHYYPKYCNQSNYFGIDLAKFNFGSHLQIITKDLITRPRGLITDTPRQAVAKNRWRYFSSKVDALVNQCHKKIQGKNNQTQNLALTTACTTANSYTPTKFNFIPHELRSTQRQSIAPIVFAILGRTKTSDHILKLAVQKKMTAYRMTENSHINYDENTRTGYITGVNYPTVNPKTGQLEIVYDESMHFDLPTVVYDYDFSSSRGITYQARGDRIIGDKLSSVKKSLQKTGAIYFNQESNASLVERSKLILDPTRSQLALANVFKRHAPEISKHYPETISLSLDPECRHTIMNFITTHTQFYIKPVLSERCNDVNSANIYMIRSDEYNVQPDRSYLLLKYLVTNSDLELDAKSYKVYIDELSDELFLSLINKIKHEMGYVESTAFLIQQAFKTPSLFDQSNRSISQKLRVVTQYNTNELVVSSLYGVYGGPNSFLAYTGDAKIYVNSYITNMCSQYQTHQIINFIKTVAIATHKTIETSSNSVVGELIIDMILTEQGIVPLKVSTKPERPNLNLIAEQTHYGCIFEKDQEQRQQFIRELREMENYRSQLIINEVIRLHQNKFVPAELIKKNEVDLIRFWCN